MADELAWRKFPRSAISSAELDYISFTMKPEHKTAPYMFFFTMYCRCDDNGVFDLDDGIIFARLMKTDDASVVFKVADALCQRGIITRVIENEWIFMIADWDAPDRKNNFQIRTMEQRRAAIAQKIMAERSAKNPGPRTDFPFPPTTQNYAPAAAPQIPEPAPTVTMTEADRAKILADAFSGSVQSAAPIFFGSNSTKTENLSTEQREREKERDIQREDIDKKEIHTQEIREKERDQTEIKSEREAKELPANSTEASSSFADKTKQDEEQQEEQQEELEPGDQSFIDIAMTKKKANEIEKKKSEDDEYLSERKNLREICEGWFIKNCLGFNAVADLDTIEVICRRAFQLRSKHNPAETVLKTVLHTFRKLSEDNGHYKDIPLTPGYLRKQDVWVHVLQKASSILLTSKDNEEVWKAQMAKVSPEERDETEADITSRCIKYGIDPNSPNRLSALMRVEAMNSQNTG